MPEPRHPGSRWRRLIFDAHLTQSQVAERIGVSRKHLSQIINGRALPSPDITARFAAVVGKSPGKLWADVAAYQLAISMGDQGPDA
jgi:plasmid maintenance system antidote protein VapI